MVPTILFSRSFPAIEDIEPANDSSFCAILEVLKFSNASDISPIFSEIVSEASLIHPETVLKNSVSLNSSIHLPTFSTMKSVIVPITESTLSLRLTRTSPILDVTSSMLRPALSRILAKTLIANLRGPPKMVVTISTTASNPSKVLSIFSPVSVNFIDAFPASSVTSVNSLSDAANLLNPSIALNSFT